ncbi:hypothetical protein U5907_09180 [Bacteroidales bacterium MB20-C3-3]|nr:hypothetical protein U5907_09180 [Bacteroidales bacterium MB20-C3-3]
MRRGVILSFLMLLIFNISWSQLRLVPGSIEEMNFGVFYKTGSGQATITINPASPASSSYSGVVYDDISTIKPFTFRIEKTALEKLTIIIQKGRGGGELQSQDIQRSGRLYVTPNSYTIYAEGDVLESYTQNKINFREGRGFVTVRVGAKLSIPNNAIEADYISTGQYILNYWTNWQYLP